MNRTTKKPKGPAASQNRPTAPAQEVVGREYTVTVFEVHYRRAGGNRAEGAPPWYRMSKAHMTKAEAFAAMKPPGRYLELGAGFVIDFQGAKEDWEYRVVKIVKACKVLKLARFRY
jgi:hypothetical protein